MTGSLVNAVPAAPEIRAGQDDGMATDDEIERLRDRFGGDWDIRRSPEGITATHRREQPDRKRERSGFLTRVSALDAKTLRARLEVQQTLRAEIGYPYVPSVFLT
ncbi:hypothetical protein GCM10027294_52640 [Marinactinospora endophytica]